MELRIFMFFGHKLCWKLNTFVVFLSVFILSRSLLAYAEVDSSKRRYIIKLKGKALADYPEFYDYVLKKRISRGMSLKKVSLKSDDATLVNSLPDKLSSGLTLMRRNQNLLKEKIALIKNENALIKSVSLKSGVSSSSINDIEFIRETSILTNSLVVKAYPALIQKLSEMSDIDSIYEDKVVKICLDESVPLINADKVRSYTDSSGYSITGKGIRVAIIDTGVDYTHSALGGGFGSGYKVVSGYDYVNYDGDPRDDNGHGTHVAGIIAAKGETLNGVAPDAEIIALKVLDNYGSGYSSDVIEALEDALSMGANVANISLGTMDDKPLTEAAIKAVSMGMLVCAAAGNEGPTPYTINSPGDGESVLCVAACDKSRDMWYSTSIGPTSTGLLKPDITAPGENIYSTYRYSGYRYMSGTSMATPHVTGTVALLLQFEPSLTPAQIKKRLTDNAVDMGFSHYRQGYGLVDIRAALLNGGIAQAPQIEITAPLSVEDKAEVYPSRYIIKWSDWDEDSSATISLYYDNDNSGYDGTMISQGISEDSNDDFYIWDTTLISDGEYYIYAVINDGINKEVKKYSIGKVNITHSPGITMIEPASPGIIVEDRVNVFWQDYDDDDNAVIEIYCDDDKSGLDGTLISENILEDDPTNFISVDVTSFERGKMFYFYAKITDGKTEKFAYSPGYFIRNSAPEVTFEPSETGLYLVKADEIEVRVSLSDKEEFPTLNIYYDNDNSGFDGTLIIGGLTYSGDSSVDGGIISYTWGMSNVESGEYYIYISADDGINEPVFQYSEVIYLKNRPPEFFFNILNLSNDKAGENYFLEFILTDSDSEAYGKLYYDTDSSGGSGTFIASIDESVSSLEWDISKVNSGEYWIYAEVMDEYNEMKRLYTQNSLTIDHTPEILFTYPETPPVIRESNFNVLISINDENNTELTFGISKNMDYSDITYTADKYTVTPGGSNSYTINYNELENGRYYLYAQAEDISGNIAILLYNFPLFIEVSSGFRNVRIYNLRPKAFDLSFNSNQNLASTLKIIPYIVDSFSGLSTYGNTIELTETVSFNNTYIFNVNNLVFPGSEFSEKGVECSLNRNNNGIIDIYPEKENIKIVLPSDNPTDFNISKVQASNYTESSGIVFLKVKNKDNLSIRSESLSANNTIELPLSGFYNSTMQEYIPLAGDIIQIEICGNQGSDYFEVLLGETSELIVFNVTEPPSESYFRLQYESGWNLLHIPITPHPAMSSKELLEKSGAYFIARWDSELQQYQSTLMDQGLILGETFEIRASDGFFLKASASGNLKINGTYSAEISTIELGKGFSLTGFSYGYDPFLNRKSCSNIQKILSESQEIFGAYRWNNIFSSYDYRIKADDNIYLGSDFMPSYTEGLFIKSRNKNYIIDYKD